MSCVGSDMDKRNPVGNEEEEEEKRKEYKGRGTCFYVHNSEMSDDILLDFIQSLIVAAIQKENLTCGQFGHRSSNLMCSRILACIPQPQLLNVGFPQWKQATCLHMISYSNFCLERQ